MTPLLPAESHASPPHALRHMYICISRLWNSFVRDRHMIRLGYSGNGKRMDSSLSKFDNTNTGLLDHTEAFLIFKFTFVNLHKFL